MFPMKACVLLLACSLAAALLPACGRMPVPAPEPQVLLVPAAPMTLESHPLESAPVQVTALPLADDSLVRVAAVSATQSPDADVSANANAADSNVHALLDEALEYLRLGEGGDARRILQRIIAVDPGHDGAADLLRQIDLDPLDYFATTAFFTYQLQKQESLWQLAERFLGAKLKFYALARYNGIAVPAQVKRGQLIRVPGLPPADLGQTADAAQPAASAELAIARRHLDAGQYQQALTMLLPLVRADPADRQGAALLAQAVDRQSQLLARQGRGVQARKLLDEAMALLPGDPLLRKRSDWLNRQQQADGQFAEASGLIDSGDYQAAYEKLMQVLQTDPKHAGAKRMLSAIKLDVVEVFHRQAMVLYRQQQLQPAIALWDKLLVLDSDHHLARQYRERALELSRRLQLLQDND